LNVVCDSTLDVGLRENDIIDLTRIINRADWEYSSEWVEHPVTRLEGDSVIYRRSETYSVDCDGFSVKLFREDRVGSQERLPFEVHPSVDDKNYSVELHRPGRIAMQSGDYAMSLFRAVQLRGSLRVIDGGKE
jgi:hypothetical protein